MAEQFYLLETYVHTKMCMWMLIIVVFILVKVKTSYLFFSLSFVFWLCRAVYGILGPRPGIAPMSPCTRSVESKPLGNEWSSESEKKVKSLSRVRLFVTPWTVAYQAPSSMEFSRQEYWSGLPFPSPKFLKFLSIVDWISKVLYNLK